MTSYKETNKDPKNKGTKRRLRLIYVNAIILKEDNN